MGKMTVPIWSKLNADQKVGLGKWGMFSVAFGLASYLLAAVWTGFDLSELFGDGSLVLVGLSLVVAAGSAAFDDVSKIRLHWWWFGVCAMALFLTAGAFAIVRTDIRDAVALQNQPIPTLRQAIRAANANGESGDSAYTEVQLADELSRLFAEYEGNLAASEDGADSVRSLPAKEDALSGLIAPILAEKKRRDEAAAKELVRARSWATRTGVMSLVGGLILGASVVWAVNADHPGRGRPGVPGAGNRPP